MLIILLKSSFYSISLVFLCKIKISNFIQLWLTISGFVLDEKFSFFISSNFGFLTLGKLVCWYMPGHPMLKIESCSKWKMEKNILRVFWFQKYGKFCKTISSEEWIGKSQNECRTYFLCVKNSNKNFRGIFLHVN